MRYEPEKPGVKRRREELAQAERERGSYRRESDSPTTGNVETKRNVSRARANLQRLLDALKKRGVNG
jgi:hypothetical protein